MYQMYNHGLSQWLRKTAASRLFTGVRVILACFLAIGIWKVATPLSHKSNDMRHENSVALPAQAVKAVPITPPSPGPSVPPEDKNALLAHAVAEGDEASVKALLEKGADPNAVIPFEMGRLSEAALNGNLKIAKLLLRYGADVNPKSGQSPLAWASYSSSNDLPMMRLLIRAGADVNARFNKNTTVMSVARFHSGEEAVALLKRAGARE
jgi:ankyrin repeat protein